MGGPRHGGWRVRSPAAPYRACGGRWRGFRRGAVLAQGRPRAGQVAPEKSNSAQGKAGLGSADVSQPFPATPHSTTPAWKDWETATETLEAAHRLR